MPLPFDFNQLIATNSPNVTGKTIQIRSWKDGNPYKVSIADLVANKFYRAQNSGEYFSKGTTCNLYLDIEISPGHPLNQKESWIQKQEINDGNVLEKEKMWQDHV